MKNLFLVIGAVLFSFLTSCTAQEKTTMWVSGNKAEAAGGAGKMPVLQVFEGSSLQNATWQNFYAPIEGFTFTPGTMQKIEVQKTKLDKTKVPADASSIKYKLIRVLETKKEEKAQIEGNWLLAKIDGGPINRMVVVPTADIDLSQKSISGTASCNRYFGQIVEIDASKIKLGDFAITSAYCMEKNIEGEYKNALHKIDSFKVENDVLNFYDGEGKNVLTFIRKK